MPRAPSGGTENFDSSVTATSGTASAKQTALRSSLRSWNGRSIMQHRPDDCTTRRAERFARSSHLAQRGSMAPRRDQYAAGTGCDELGVGAFQRRRRIEYDDVEGERELFHERTEGGSAQQLLRIRRRNARAQQRQVRERRARLNRFVQRARLAQDVDEAEVVRDAEQLALPGRAQIRIDEDRALAELRERDREIRGQHAVIAASRWARDRERVSLRSEPVQQQLAAQAPQRLGIATERIEPGQQPGGA